MDFYGGLLTERQRSALSLHYEEDLSLSEIAERLSVSRQAVHDAIRRGEAQLDEYEARLGIIERYFKMGDMIGRVVSQAEALDQDDPKAQKLYKDIKKLEALWEE